MTEKSIIQVEFTEDLSVLKPHSLVTATQHYYHEGPFLGLPVGGQTPSRSLGYSRLNAFVALFQQQVSVSPNKQFRRVIAIRPVLEINSC